MVETFLLHVQLQETDREEAQQTAEQFQLTKLILLQDLQDLTIEEALRMLVAEQRQNLTAEAEVKETMFITHVLAQQILTVQHPEAMLRQDLQEDRVVTLTAHHHEAVQIIQRHRVLIQRLAQEVLNRTARQELTMRLSNGLTVHQLTVHRPEVTALLQAAAVVVEVEQLAHLQEDQDNKPSGFYINFRPCKMS